MLDIKALRKAGRETARELLHDDSDRSGVWTAAAVLTGFAAGVGMGLALGMLLAPRSGAETRKVLRERIGAADEEEAHRDTADQVLGVG